jgi:hypothetical protein
MYEAGTLTAFVGMLGVVDISEISGSHGGEYEDARLLRCCAV